MSDDKQPILIRDPIESIDWSRVEWAQLTKFVGGTPDGRSFSLPIIEAEDVGLSVTVEPEGCLPQPIVFSAWLVEDEDA